MSISKLYLNLVKNPNISKIYREIRKYYLINDMHLEADAFTHLLLKKFNQDVRFFDDNDTDTNQE